MDIRQLRYFIEVAKYMSFTKAAEQINVSQPSLSKTIKNLEDELGTSLFDRTTQKMNLTDTGKIAFEQAQEVMKLMDNFSSEISDVMHIKRGKIIIGIPPVIGSLFFPKLVGDFQSMYPEIEVEVIEEGAKKIEKLVEDGSIDIGVSLLPNNEDLFEVYPFASRELKLIVDGKHPLASSRQIPLTDLKDERFIFFKKDFALHDRIFTACVEAGFEPLIAFESSQWDFISEMVANRLGIAILPETLCEKLDPNRIKTISIVEPTILWSLSLIWRKDKYLSYLTKEFIRFFRTSFSETN